MKKLVLLICSVLILFSCGEYTNTKVDIDSSIIINENKHNSENSNKIVEIKKNSSIDIIEGNKQKQVNINKYIENYLGIDYLLLENGSLYCVFGNENELNPMVGIMYSKEKIGNVNNPQKLKVIDYTYFSDDNFIYSHESICTTGMPGECLCSFVKENYDVETFEKLDFYYYKDKNSVYNLGYEVDGANAESFEVVDGDWYNAKDKNNFYLDGEVVINNK